MSTPRRLGNLLILHGDTLLRAGDQVTSLLRHGDAAQLWRCLLGDPRGEAAYERE